MTTLLDLMGGRSAVTAAVDLFYEKVLADPELAPFFEGINMDHQCKRQVSFLCSVMAGTSKFTETYMRNAHRRLVEEKGLSEDHFDLVATHLISALDELNVSEGVVQEVVAAVSSLQNHVLNRDMASAA